MRSMGPEEGHVKRKVPLGGKAGERISFLPFVFYSRMFAYGLPILLSFRPCMSTLQRCSSCAVLVLNGNSKAMYPTSEVGATRRVCFVLYWWTRIGAQLQRKLPDYLYGMRAVMFARLLL